MDIQHKLKTTSRIVQGVFYMLASLFHFVTDKELAVIPPFLPWRRAALWITGIFEFLGGLGLLIPRFQRPASWGLATLLVAIWPANIYHAVSDRRSKRWRKTRIYHLLRSPMQIALIAWVLWAANDQHE